jgi:hypothetical protein
MRIYLVERSMHNHKEHVWKMCVLQFTVHVFYLVLNQVPSYKFVITSSFHLFSRISVTYTIRSGNIALLDVFITTPVLYYRLIYTSTE